MLYMAQPTFPVSVLARDESAQPEQTATPSSNPSGSHAAACDTTSRFSIGIVRSLRFPLMGHKNSFRARPAPRPDRLLRLPQRHHVGRDRRHVRVAQRTRIEL